MPDYDGFGSEDVLLKETWPFWKRKDPVDQAKGYKETPWHMLVNSLLAVVDGKVRGAPVRASQWPTC